jgi:hypothetical protein
MAVRIMSDVELTKFEVIRDLGSGRLSVRTVASILGVSERQVWRLLRAFRATGVGGLISKKRGRPRNLFTPSHVRKTVMEIVKPSMPTSVLRWWLRSCGRCMVSPYPGRLSDNGIGRTDVIATPVKGGLGTNIVKSLARQLGATVEITSGAHGMNVAVTHADFVPV